ncbi:probable tRNA threonylcarbamoyladenosine biosynthesis protein Gcp [Bacteroides sp. CAG:144]|nr:probable tRNA threonylcarbamoyladenosine biosynthesis protein Gcp [Bacteroides sp. CAG:144]
MSITVLGIESSCDDTSAAVIRDGGIGSRYSRRSDVVECYSVSGCA